MKKISIIPMTFIVILALATSCEEMFGDFLDKAPGVDVNEDTLFNSGVQLEKLVVALYAYGSHNDWQESGSDGRFGSVGTHDFMYDGATDAGKAVASWFWTNFWTSGNIHANDNREHFRLNRYYSIRRANIILERIDQVPDITEEYKNQVIAECNLIRAYNHFCTFMCYGGIPLIGKRLTVEDDYYIPRSSVKETIEFILEDIEKAIPFLPDVYPATQYGRATKGAALALKAKVLLFAASPLYNTDKPYLELPGHKDLLCYENYDINRWQLAADAAKAVLDWAPSGGISLIDDKGLDENYRALWEEYANRECIWNHSMKRAVPRGSAPWSYFLPAVLYSGYGGNSVPLNFIKLYRKQDGSEQNWDMRGGDNLNEIYESMETRFKQTYAYNLSYWNRDHQVMELWQADPANGISVGKHTNKCSFGVWGRKPVPASMGRSGPSSAWVMEHIFRLGEIYLYYAEALNEAQGPVPEAYAAINTIRNRGGLPDLEPGLTQEQFRNEVRREFSIEMVYENHRFWNLRRWREAHLEGRMKGPMWGIKIYRIPDTTPGKYRYEPYVVETRVFHDRFYLHPWAQSEVNKGYLIQNPGY